MYFNFFPKKEMGIYAANKLLSKFCNLRRPIELQLLVYSWFMEESGC
jgi:hypothetical protein